MRARLGSVMALVLLGGALLGGCGGATSKPQCGGAHDEEGCEEQGAFRCGFSRRESRPPRYVTEPVPLEELAHSAPPLLLEHPLSVDGVDVHPMFPAEQTPLTPVPFYFELPDRPDVVAAVLRYKPFGEAMYRKLEMSRLGVGFAAVIPCVDVQVTGHLRYYVLLLDGSEETVDSLGSRKEFLTVNIRNTLQGGPPSLPGKPPERCREAK